MIYLQAVETIKTANEIAKSTDWTVEGILGVVVLTLIGFVLYREKKNDKEKEDLRKEAEKSRQDLVSYIIQESKDSKEILKKYGETTDFLKKMYKLNGNNDVI